MVQAQGVRRFDPYRCLQVDPQAPRELIVEAYWSLVNRSRRSDIESADGARRTHEMRAAYALLADDTRRRAFDAAGTGAPAAQRADHYAALFVDPEADAGIIDLAYALLSRDDQTKKRSVGRLTRDEAYRVLSNPQLRAQYDATRERRAEPVRLSLINVNGHEPEASKDEPKPRGGFLGIGRKKLKAPDARDQRLLTLREAALSWDVAQAPEAEPEQPDEPPPVVEGAAAELVFVSGPHAGRRIALSDSTISLGGGRRDDVMLERGAPEGCIAVWQHGSRFMMRHAPEAGVTVGGRPLALTIVVLDDGDEIALGAHQMRFRRIPDA